MSVAAVRTACCLIAALAAASATCARASTDLDDARRLVAGGEYAAALKAAKRALKAHPASDEAVVLAASAELGLHDYTAALARLERAPKSCDECAALLAVAADLDAERNPGLPMPEVRKRWRTAEEAAARAIASDRRERNLHVVRTTALTSLGDYGRAGDAVAAWEAAYPGDALAAAAHERIDEARARWAALDGPAIPALLSQRNRRNRENALLSKLAPDTDGSEAKEVDALLSAETDRETRAQLLVLRIALRESLGKAELAILEGWEAGFLDERHAVKAALAVRRLDPSDRVDPALHLDGASKPEPLDEPKGLKVDTKGGRLGGDALYRVEPSGRVGPVLPLFGVNLNSSGSTFAYLKSERFRPAVRDGVPVAVPMHAELTVTEEMISISGPLEVAPW